MAINCIISVAAEAGITFTVAPVELVSVMAFTVMPKAMIQSAGASPRPTCMGVVAVVGVGAGEPEAVVLLPPPQPKKPNALVRSSPPAAALFRYRNAMSSSEDYSEARCSR